MRGERVVWWLGVAVAMAGCSSPSQVLPGAGAGDTADTDASGATTSLSSSGPGTTSQGSSAATTDDTTTSQSGSESQGETTTTGPAGSTGGGTSGGTDGTTGGAGSTGTPAVCEPVAGDLCLTCVSANCCAQLLECVGDPTCACFYDCIASGNLASCAACGQPPAGGVAETTLNCGINMCGGQCGL